MSALVTNTGKVSGRAVLQSYVTYPTAANEPRVQLKAIGSATLAAGTTARVSMRISRSSLEITPNGTWLVPTGTYVLGVGWSSTDLPLSATFTVPK